MNNPNEVWYPNNKEMQSFNDQNPTTYNKDSIMDIDATFIHNTNTYGSTRIPQSIQNEFFTKLLKTNEFSNKNGKVEHF